MSSAIVSPGELSGKLSVPPSKSAAHRAIICAALSQGESFLSPVADSKDIEATIRAISVLGAHVALQEDLLCVSGIKKNSLPVGPIPVDCGESGSTLRFLIPIFGALGISALFTGHERLPQRPIGCYLDCLPAHGLTCDTKGGLPLAISGKLTCGTFSLPGNVSSQFITGLLLALPLLKGNSEIILTTPLQSTAYVEMTIETMVSFGVTVIPTETGWQIPGGQTYHACQLAVERDWSQAAFFLAASALGSNLSLLGLSKGSAQGDRAALELFRKFGAQINWEKDGSLHAKAGTLSGIEIDAGEIPDLVPALAVCAALSPGRTVISNAQRLRIKESDRLKAIHDGLSALGAHIIEKPDGLIINGISAFHGGEVDGFHDHRIVMALSIAALSAESQVTIHGAEAIQKSYPNFFEDFKRLGGNVHVIMG